MLRLALNTEILLFAVDLCAEASPEHRDPAMERGAHLFGVFPWGRQYLDLSGQLPLVSPVPKPPPAIVSHKIQNRRNTQ